MQVAGCWARDEAWAQDRGGRGLFCYRFLASRESRVLMSAGTWLLWNMARAASSLAKGTKADGWKSRVCYSWEQVHSVMLLLFTGILWVQRPLPQEWNAEIDAFQYEWSAGGRDPTKNTNMM